MSAGTKIADRSRSPRASAAIQIATVVAGTTTKLPILPASDICPLTAATTSRIARTMSRTVANRAPKAVAIPRPAASVCETSDRLPIMAA